MSQQLKTLAEIGSNKSFNGFVKKFQHKSNTLGGLNAKFSIYLPPKAIKEHVPVLIWLSGLTCNEDNFMHKAAAQKYAAKYNIAIVSPDTSPRGANIKGENDNWDFGVSAGFYVNATESPWNEYYQMYDYINTELFEILRTYTIESKLHSSYYQQNEMKLPLDMNKVSIFGHSMGGHGALISFLKNPKLYKSVSAFSPICNPINCKWGKKNFSGYLGTENINEWKLYDTCELIQNSKIMASHKNVQILVDQGTKDDFLCHGEDKHNQLLPEKLEEVCKKQKISLQMRYQEGYDHSYYFISTFIEDHIAYHAKFLQ